MNYFIIVFAGLVLYTSASHESIQLIRDSHTYSLNDTNLLDEYVLHAMDCLDEAYKLYPTDSDADTRIQSFSGLFNDTYPVDGGWSVAQGCVAIYTPKRKYYITLKVTAQSSRVHESIRETFDAVGDDDATTVTATTVSTSTSPSNSYYITIYN